MKPDVWSVSLCFAKCFLASNLEGWDALCAVFLQTDGNTVVNGYWITPGFCMVSRMFLQRLHHFHTMWPHIFAFTIKWTQSPWRLSIPVQCGTFYQGKAAIQSWPSLLRSPSWGSTRQALPQLPATNLAAGWLHKTSLKLAAWKIYQPPNGGLIYLSLWLLPQN